MSIIEKGNEWARKNPFKFILIAIALIGLSIKIGFTIGSKFKSNNSNSSSNESAQVSNEPEEVGVSDGNIATKTYKSGYYYLFLKSDHSIEIYQKSSSSSYARGCAADGKWSIENGKVKVQVIQSYCETESYTKFNGVYEFKGNCIENERFSFCND